MSASEISAERNSAISNPAPSIYTVFVPSYSGIGFYDMPTLSLEFFNEVPLEYNYGSFETRGVGFPPVISDTAGLRLYSSIECNRRISVVKTYHPKVNPLSGKRSTRVVGS